MYFLIFFFQEALKELGELKELVPKESIVYFLIGKVSSLQYSLTPENTVVCSYIYQKSRLMCHLN